MNKPLSIEYYTDILCVWAWVAQRRIDELNAKLSNKIELNYYYVDIFGDVPNKMKRQWGEKGSYTGFAQHVQHSASQFENAPVSPKIWIETKPTTSANAHLFLKAIELSHSHQHSMDMALKFREAFFEHALDISNTDTLYQLIEDNHLNTTAISLTIKQGTAMASLMGDYQKAKQQNIQGSPTYVMDGGRQTLYGNVGYRVLFANIEELLKKPINEASWC